MVCRESTYTEQTRLTRLTRCTRGRRGAGVQESNTCSQLGLGNIMLGCYSGHARGVAKRGWRNRGKLARQNQVYSAAEESRAQGMRAAARTSDVYARSPQCGFLSRKGTRQHARCTQERWVNGHCACTFRGFQAPLPLGLSTSSDGGAYIPRWKKRKLKGVHFRSSSQALRSNE
jgi:hypothetical protein